MMKSTLAIVMFSAVAALPISSHAESKSGHFKATLTLVMSCSIEKVSPSNAGPLSIDIAYSKGSSYDAGLSNGHGTRTLKSANGKTKYYEVYPHRAHSLEWQNESVLSATGTGAVVSHWVGQGKTATHAETPNDIMTITLTF